MSDFDPRLEWGQNVGPIERFLANMTLPVLLVAGLWSCHHLATRPERMFVQTYSTPSASFDVANGYLEFLCDHPTVVLTALNTDREWTGYVYGPRPGVPCARERPHYRSQAWCTPMGCVVSDIPKEQWDALFRATEHHMPDKRPLT